MKDTARKMRNRFLIALGTSVAIGFLALCWVAYRIIDTYYFTPACSERNFETVAYANTYWASVVTPEEINSGEYCAMIEGMDDQDRTDCWVAWIDETAEIAYVQTHLTVDCHYSHQTGPDRYFDGLIVRGDVVTIDDYEEAIQYPKRSGKYIEKLHLTEEEIVAINTYLENLKRD